MKAGQFLFRAIPLLIMLGFAVMLALSLGRPKYTKEHMLGKTVLAFDIPELNKPNAHFTPDAWKGKVAIVNIFATWCEPCKAEHDTLLELARVSKAPLLGIAWKDREDKVAEWLKVHGNPYQIVGFDAKGRVTVPFAMTGVPETFVFDKQGRIRYHYAASLTDDVITDDIAPLLEQLEKEDAPAQ